MRRNLYSEPSKEEKAQQEAQKREIEAKFKAVTEIAAKCLDDAKFLKYRQEFEKLESLTLRYIEEYPANEEPIKDAYQIRAAVNKLGVLRLLLRMVERDNKRGNKHGIS
jgi:hypothetical protein